MAKPRVLIFIDWFLPGYKAGGPIQSCVNLINYLKDDFDFWVITRDTDYCEITPYTTVTSNTWNQLAPHLKVYYASEPRLNYRTLNNAARQAQPDIVFINGIYSLYFSVLPVRIGNKIGCKTIVSARGMLAPSAIDVKGSKKKIFLKVSQLVGYYKEVYFHATNQTEKEQIEAIFGKKQKIRIAPNLPKLLKSVDHLLKNKNAGKLNLVSISRISPEKNQLYALQVLQNYCFDGFIQFDLYGPIYNEGYWNACQLLIKNLPSHIKVNYKGSIGSQLVTETLQQYDALFLPTRGENFGHVILESFMAGLPVIISDQTPWQNLEQMMIGFNLPLNKPQVFAATIQQMLDMSQETYNQFSVNAFRFALEFAQDKDAIAQNKALFDIA